MDSIVTTTGPAAVRLWLQLRAVGSELCWARLYAFPNEITEAEAARLAEGAWIVVGSPLTCAVAQVVDVTDGIVHVLPLPGSVEDNADLLSRRA
jgi:hypothetical protein